MTSRTAKLSFAGDINLLTSSEEEQRHRTMNRIEPQGLEVWKAAREKVMVSGKEYTQLGRSIKINVEDLKEKKS